VHIVTEGPLGWSALQAATHLKLPVVSDFRTNFHAYSSHYGVGWLRTPVMAYLRRFHNRTQCTMVPTETLSSELAASGFEGLRVVARGVDTHRFTPARRSDHLRAHWGAGPNTLVALCVGRLAAEKNLGALIEAAAAMREHAPGMRLVLVGDGPERARMQKHCAHAVFAGVRHGDDLAAHYASADLFLFPSMTETFGNVVPEAMASGLAVVAYDHAAAGQLIRHGHNGLLARFGDQPGFCRLARHAVADHAQVRALGLQARTSVLSLDWRHIIDAVESEYAAAIAGVSAFAPVAPSAAPCTPPQTDPVRP
jgi:glycosyltransferase involved in cell wall biosynthesis